MCGSPGGESLVAAPTPGGETGWKGEGGRAGFAEPSSKEPWSASWCGSLILSPLTLTRGRVRVLCLGVQREGPARKPMQSTVPSAWWALRSCHSHLPFCHGSRLLLFATGVPFSS